jgi:hypothetical protein
VAGAFGTDANPYPIERDEYRSGYQPGGLNNPCGHIFAHRQQLRILDDIFCLRWIHGNLFHNGGFLPA